MDDAPYELNSTKSSNLRFFGDTDQESTTNEIYPSAIKPKYDIGHVEKFTDSDSDFLIISNRPESQTKSTNSKISTSKKYKSKCDLDKPDYGLQQMNYGLQTTLNKFENHWPDQREHSSVKNGKFNINQYYSIYLPQLYRKWFFNANEFLQNQTNRNIKQAS